MDYALESRGRYRTLSRGSNLCRCQGVISACLFLLTNLILMASMSSWWCIVFGGGGVPWGPIPHLDNKSPFPTHYQPSDFPEHRPYRSTQTLNAFVPIPCREVQGSQSPPFPMYLWFLILFARSSPAIAKCWGSVLCREGVELPPPPLGVTKGVCVLFPIWTQQSATCKTWKAPSFCLSVFILLYTGLKAPIDS